MKRINIRKCFETVFSINLRCLLILVAGIFIGFGCSGGGGGGGSSSVSSGSFVDNVVEGLEYETNTQSGLTDKDGNFKYKQGETVTFRIGGLFLGQCVALKTLTPIDIVNGAIDETDPMVTNLCRLLQSLDEDGDLRNGITISAEIRQEIEGRSIDFDQSTTEFEDDPNVKGLFNALNASGVFTNGTRTLTSVAQAQSHMRMSISNTVEEDAAVEINVVLDEELLENGQLIMQREWPEASNDEVDDLVAGNNMVAFELYHQMKTGNSNLFFSPYTIRKTMAMTVAGARGESKKQIQEAMKFNLDFEALHSAFNSLDLNIQTKGTELPTPLSRSEFSETMYFTNLPWNDYLMFWGAASFAQQEDVPMWVLPTSDMSGALPMPFGEGPVLDLFSKTWGQTSYFVPVTYYNQFAAHYGASIQPLDFDNEHWASEQEIEEWVSAQTKNAISNTTTSITSRVRLAFADTAVLDADWENPFDDTLTFYDTFELIGGSHVDASVMTQTGTFSFLKADGYEAVELPFKDSDLTMLVLIPDSGNFNGFDNDLDDSVLEGIITSLEPSELTLYVPKYSLGTDCELNNTLEQLGIHDALYEGLADFSGVNEADDLYINGSRLKATVTVGEAGVKGAAFSVVTIEGKEEIPPFDYYGIIDTILYGEYLYDGIIFSLYRPITEVSFCRPFIFIIRDTSSGAVLFLGRVMNP